MCKNQLELLMRYAMKLYQKEKELTFPKVLILVLVLDFIMEDSQEDR